MDNGDHGDHGPPVLPLDHVVLDPRKESAPVTTLHHLMEGVHVQEHPRRVQHVPSHVMEAGDHGDHGPPVLPLDHVALDQRKESAPVTTQHHLMEGVHVQAHPQRVHHVPSHVMEGGDLGDHGPPVLLLDHVAPDQRKESAPVTTLHHLLEGVHVQEYPQRVQHAQSRVTEGGDLGDHGQVVVRPVEEEIRRGRGNATLLFLNMEGKVAREYLRIREVVIHHHVSLYFKH